jgi:hypothetical protein
MNTIATRLQVGAAAVAVATAATLVPVAAQAAPEIAAPTAPVTQVIDRMATGVGSLPEFQFFWFGTPNPNPPAHITLINNLTLPIISTVLVGLGLGNKEICLGGASVKIGSYGGISVSLGLGC